MDQDHDEELNDIIRSLTELDSGTFVKRNTIESVQGPELLQRHLSEPNIYRDRDQRRVNSTSIGTLHKRTAERERDIKIEEMAEKFGEYSESCEGVYSWVVPKETVKNSDRFNLIKPWCWGKKNSQGIQHRNITDTREFVESLQKMQGLLADYLALTKTYLESGWDITSEVLHQFNWFEGNIRILDQIIQAMDKDLTRKMTKDHRVSVKDKIINCKSTIHEIQVYSSASKRGLLRTP